MFTPQTHLPAAFGLVRAPSKWWTGAAGAGMPQQAVTHQVTYSVCFQNLAHFSSLMLSVHGPEGVNGTPGC